MEIVLFMAACSFQTSLGPCRYVEELAAGGVSLLRHCRLALARTSAHATTFVEASWAIALRHFFAVLVRSRRRVVKSSWRRTVARGFLDLSEFVLDWPWLTSSYEIF